MNHNNDDLNFDNVNQENCLLVGVSADIAVLLLAISVIFGGR